jgi:hypothetical protein
MTCVSNMVALHVVYQLGQYHVMSIKRVGGFRSTLRKQEGLERYFA